MTASSLTASRQVQPAVKRATRAAGRQVLFRPRTWAMLAGAAVPVGYVTYKHVAWESTSDGKKRMLTHQGLFWGATAWSLRALHKLSRKKMRLLPKTLLCMLASAPPAVAFESGMYIAEWLFPHKPKPSPSNPYVPPQLRQAASVSSPAIYA